jgi:hypothetical protein
MKNKTSTKFTMLLSSLLFLFAINNSFACGGGEIDDSPYCLFSPNISRGNPDFYYNFERISGSHDFEGINIEEWVIYFHNKISHADMSFIVYKTELKFIDSLLILIRNGESNNNILKKSPLLNFAPKEKLKQFYEYLYLSKLAEPSFTYEYGWWESPEENFEKKRQELSEINFEKNFYEISNPFLKQRYGFQVIRKMYHSGNYREGIDFFNKHLKDLDSSPSIAKRTLGFKAACHYKLEEYHQANLIYAILFDFMPNASMWSFRVTDEKDWQEILNLSSDKETKIKLWFMMGYYLDPLRAMKEIYKINPNSSHLKELSVRAINIQEEVVFKKSREEYYSYIPPFAESNQIEHLKNFLEQIYSDNKIQDSQFWLITSGYVSFLNNQYETAKKYFSLAEKFDLNEVEKNQIRITTLLMFLKSAKPDVQEETFLLDEITWLLSLDKSIYHYRENLQHHVFSTLSDKYREINDPVKSEVCRRNVYNYYYNISSFYNESGNDQLMLDFLRKESKTKWEDYLKSIYPFSEEDIIEWQILQLIYSGEFTPAKELMDHSKNCFNQILYGDPFVIHIVDCHDCDHAAPQKKKYSKRDFFDKLISLKQSIDQTKGDVCNNSYMLANGLYNYTYYGNARIFYMSSISWDIGYTDGYGYYSYYDNYNQRDYKNLPLNIWSMEMPKRYYQIAYENCKNTEQKAKLCWMLAKCELNDFYNGEVEVPDQFKNADFIAGLHMKEFAAKYSNTKYYKEVIKECGYFRTYLKNN